MIIFERIRWKNFLSTGNNFTEINLAKNKLTLIVGANGAGKSTVLDALSFALFGKPFREVNKPTLVNSINQKNLEVELEFSIGKRKYKIKRGIKPNIFEIYQDGTMINQSAESKEYQTVLENNILKFNHKSFSQIVVLGNASFIPFMQLPAGHRREIIEDLLDIQIFSSMNTLLKTKISDNKQSITDAEYNIKLANEKIEMQKKHLHSLKINSDELIKQKQDKIKELSDSVANTKLEIGRCNGDILKHQESIADSSKVTSKIKKLGDIKIQLVNKLDKLNKDIEFFTDNAQCPTCKQGIEDGHKHQIVTKSNNSITEVEEGIVQLNTELDNLIKRKEEIDTVNNSINTINNTISNLNVQIKLWTDFVDGLNKEITQLKKERKTTEDDSSVLKQLKQEYSNSVKTKEELIEEKGVLDVAQMLLKDSGIKTKIIKQYIPVMNKLINKHLAAMDFFVNFELNENFEEVIKSRHRDIFSYGSFSEGEKMRIDLALLFTWRAIAKLRNSVSTNLLIMDEVFDSSLDVNGTDEFMKMLNSLTGDTNVFIISHKGDQLFDKFSNIIKFEKVNNFSRIVK